MRTEVDGDVSEYDTHETMPNLIIVLGELSADKITK